MVGTVSGVTYHGGMAETENINVNAGETDFVRVTVRFSGQGQAEDILLQYLLRYHITPDGDLDIDLVQDRIICN